MSKTQLCKTVKGFTALSQTHFRTIFQFQENQNNPLLVNTLQLQLGQFKRETPLNKMQI